MAARFERPSDDQYYERERVKLFSQGDLFRDVPLEFPVPADLLIVDDDEAEADQRRSFLKGPLTFGPAILITPSCSLGGTAGSGYDHPVRTLVPLMPLVSLVDAGVVKQEATDDIRRYDHLINYMYFPRLGNDELEFEMPESLALLYYSVTLHHDFLEGNRVTQLAFRGAQQLHRKLVWFFSGWLQDDLDLFNPPMD